MSINIQPLSDIFKLSLCSTLLCTVPHCTKIAVPQKKTWGWYCPVQLTQKEEQEESNIVTTEIVEPG